uniref:Uncharacterized protein n=1 Tax=Metapenaeus joyneri majanivirus TaxID=2984280 RepID=A0A9C7BN43_9VIRU|nr:MAG: hypothetical protein [Metapenaeus joyneri majanivirus]
MEAIIPLTWQKYSVSLSVEFDSIIIKQLDNNVDAILDVLKMVNCTLMYERQSPPSEIWKRDELKDLKLLPEKVDRVYNCCLYASTIILNGCIFIGLMTHEYALRINHKGRPAYVFLETTVISTGEDAGCSGGRLYITFDPDIFVNSVLRFSRDGVRELMKREGIQILDHAASELGRLKQEEYHLRKATTDNTIDKKKFHKLAETRNHLIETGYVIDKKDTIQTPLWTWQKEKHTLSIHIAKCVHKIICIRDFCGERFQKKHIGKGWKEKGQEDPMKGKIYPPMLYYIKKGSRDCYPTNYFSLNLPKIIVKTC